MPALRGLDYVVQVLDGALWRTVAGQRGGTLNMGTAEIDTTSKDGAGWEEKIGGLRNWSIDTDLLHSEVDLGLAKLETAFLAGNTVNVRMRFPSGATYSGLAIITAFNIEAPHDGVATASITLSGTGALTKA